MFFSPSIIGTVRRFSGQIVSPFGSIWFDWKCFTWLLFVHFHSNWFRFANFGRPPPNRHEQFWIRSVWIGGHFYCIVIGWPVWIAFHTQVLLLSQKNQINFCMDVMFCVVAGGGDGSWFALLVPELSLEYSKFGSCCWWRLKSEVLWYLQNSWHLPTISIGGWSKHCLILYFMGQFDEEFGVFYSIWIIRFWNKCDRKGSIGQLHSFGIFSGFF